MSALVRITDSSRTSREVRKVPRSEVGAESFDYFVGERHQIRRQLNSGGICGFQIDHERIASRLLERQITWVRALEDTGDKVAGALERLVQIRAIRHQAAVANEEIVLIDRR